MSQSVNVLFVGDIVGTPGMMITENLLRTFIEKYKIDFVIANGENAFDGKSISEDQIKTLYGLGVDVITSGNHIWERHHIYKILANDPKLLRPANYPQGNSGRGFGVYDLGGKGKIAVANLQGRTYMFDIDCPFKTADWILSKIEQETKVIILDMHAEATAEKMAIAWYLDGKVSAVIGTLTHVQTADARILPLGTSFITDVGMTGPHESVVGLKKEIALRRFMYATPHKYETAKDDLHFSAVILSIETETGKTLSIESLFYPEFPRHGNDH